MNPPRFVLLLLLLTCVGAKCIAQKPDKKTQEREWREMFGTNLTNCKPRVGENDEGARLCKGFGGYSLLLKGDEKRPEMFLVDPDGKRHSIEYWDRSDTGYRGMHPGVNWVVVNTPKNTIAIDLSLSIEPKEDYGEWGGYDVVVRVSPGPVCVIGSLPSESGSGATAIAIASNPTAYPCLGVSDLQKRDWFLTARRLANEGKVQETRSALEQIKGYERFIIYLEISGAQFKAGDAEGARRTLMTARAEALEKRSVESLEHTLGYVVTGLAQSGFYAEAKSDIKLFKKDDQLGMYLSIAAVQVEKNDFEAAKTTYREAIDQEFGRTPLPVRDWSLARIFESQIRVRLYDEARRTISMIQDTEIKKGLEKRLPKEPAQLN